MTEAAKQIDEAVELEVRADRAAAAGDVATARRFLQQATERDPGRGEAWLKLSAMCRAQKDLPAALAAISGALKLDPLAFLPLLLKASLLEQSGQTDAAGETYGYALAQQPEIVPPQLGGLVERGRRAHGTYLEQRAQRIDRAKAASEAELLPAEQARVERFRDNILRRTRPFHSEPTDFHYPGLREREYHEREDFPWLETLEAATEAIAGDFRNVMAAERAELIPYIDYPEDLPLRQWAELNRNPAWTAIHLVRNGAVVDANTRHCPATMALLGGLDQPNVPGRGPNAMFSLLAPGAHIPPHTGVANTRLVCHLPLIVPPGCWFRVGAETREWKAGQAWVFDDTIEHEAMNPSDQLRVILIVDTWHPDLSNPERDAVAAVMAATDLAAGAGL